MKVTYNAPVILSFAFVAVAVQILSDLTGGAFTKAAFAVYPPFVWADPLCWFRLFSHVIGHAGWGHLIGNFSMILLLGPMLEEKYGSRDLLEMMGITALVTGVFNLAVFGTGLLGASGIVFMLILLGSMSNFRQGELPLTFVLVAVLFLGKELVSGLKPDNVANSAHIVGGLCGAGFGFLVDRRRR